MPHRKAGRSHERRASYNLTDCSRIIGICQAVPTHRQFRLLRSSEGSIALHTILQEGTLGIFFGQVLGYPEHRDERASLGVKTRDNRTFFHGSFLSTVVVRVHALEVTYLVGRQSSSHSNRAGSRRYHLPFRLVRYVLA